MSRGAPVDFPGAKVIRSSEKALLVRFALKKDGTDVREVWVPRSVIHEDSEVYDSTKNTEGKLVLPQWFAEERELL